MTRYVAFLRAVNVGGSAVVKMDDVRRAFEKAGGTSVRTFIASGNVVFDAMPSDVERVQAAATAGLKRLVGGEPQIMLRTVESLREIVRARPFDGHDATRLKFYVVFLGQRVDPPAKRLQSAREVLEAIRHDHESVYLVSGMKKNGMYGFPNTFVEEELEVPATSRNWNTVCRIVDFALAESVPAIKAPRMKRSGAAKRAPKKRSAAAAQKKRRHPAKRSR